VRSHAARGRWPAGDGRVQAQGAGPGRTAPADSNGYSDIPDDSSLEPVKEPALFAVNLGWDLSLPLGSTADFTDQFSVQGFSIEVRYLGLGNLELGGLVAWHTLAQKGYSTTTDDTGTVTVSGTTVHELSSNPLLFRARYSFRQGPRPDKVGQLIPYVVAGFGGARALRRVDFGIDRYSTESWHWALGPEAGIELPVGPAALNLAARFNYLFETGSAPEQLYMNFVVGVSLE
ncbi:MAG TPA: hypothetical protein VLC09_13340, partial [Polyangiaceae bacterium]|nr:hypothetical protein [Polyangiaceae bacterium]